MCGTKNRELSVPVNCVEKKTGGLSVTAKTVWKKKQGDISGDARRPRCVGVRAEQKAGVCGKCKEWPRGVRGLTWVSLISLVSLASEAVDASGVR